MRRLKGDETPRSFLALSRHTGRKSTCLEGRAEKFLPDRTSLAYFNETMKYEKETNQIKIIL